jgi:HEXXH motif-containing protein
MSSRKPLIRHYALWRPDPRPLHQRLHGTYALIDVTHFWMTTLADRRTVRGLRSEAREGLSVRQGTRRGKPAIEEVGQPVSIGASVSVGQRFEVTLCAEPGPTFVSALFCNGRVG